MKEKRYFAVVNNTGEDWPAWGVARISQKVSEEHGPGDEIPVYEIDKPDGQDGIYVANGPSYLPTGSTGEAIYMQDADYVRVENDEVVSIGETIGPEAEKWFCTGEGSELICRDAKGDLDIVPVIGNAVPGGGGTTVQDDDCACYCIGSPDIEVNGVACSYKVTIPLGQAMEFQECGVLVFKQGTRTLTNTGSRASPNDEWRYTLSADDTIAFHYDGTEVDLEITGTITWSPFLTPKAKAVLSVTGEIPEP